jgi:hypothetical protein
MSKSRGGKVDYKETLPSVPTIEDNNLPNRSCTINNLKEEKAKSLSQNSKPTSNQIEIAE